MAFSSLPFILFLFIPFSRCASLLHGTISGNGESLVQWTRRTVEEPIFPAEVVGNTSFILAAQRTHRKDPLSGFKHYTGGWNISENHYWASVGFTAAPLFVIALIWILSFASTVLLISLCYYCCPRRSFSYSRMAHAVSLVFMVLCAISAIIGCIILYIGQVKFHVSMSDTLDFVDKQANTTVVKLRNFSDNLYAATKVGVDQVFLPATRQGQIVAVATRVNSTANIFDIRASNNSRKIRNLLNQVRLVAAVMFFFVFLGLLLSVFGKQLLLYHLVPLGWLLVAATFIVCGVFLILHNVIADTCISMNEWVLRPSTHTALDDLLPCVDVATANNFLYRSKEVTYNLVNVVNQVIVNISNKNFSWDRQPNSYNHSINISNIFPLGLPSLYYNQSGPVIPALCNPYNSDLTDHTCDTGEVNFNNATQVWRGYVCNASVFLGSEICTTVGRITPNIYQHMAAAVSVSFGLHNYAPFLAQLEDCTFLRQTFSSISENHCAPIRRYSRWVCVGLAMVSTAVMLSLIFWIVFVREQQYARISRRRNGRNNRRRMLEFTVLGGSFG